MYYYVIENTQRNRQPVYRLAATYRQYGALRRFLERQGKPVWIVTDRRPIWEVTPGWTPEGLFGGFTTANWNSGRGWAEDWMPPLPLLKE